MDVTLKKDNSTKIDVLDVLRNQLDKAKNIRDVMNIRHVIDNLPVNSADVPEPVVTGNEPLLTDAPEKIDNVGGIDWSNILNTLLNKERAKGAKDLKTAASIPGPMGELIRLKTGKNLPTDIPGPIGDVAKMVQLKLDEENGGSSLTAKYINQFLRVYGKAGAKLAGVPITKEQQALDALEKLYGKKGLYSNERGLKRYAGVGRFETPYGRMYIDESGTLTKEPTEHAGAIRTI